MGLYTKALHHVNNKDFKKTHQRRCNEQKSLYLEEKKNKLIAQKEIDKIKKLSENLKYDWRKKLNEGMTSSGVFFNDYQSTGDVNLETIFAGNQDSFIFNGVGTEVKSGGFDSSSGNYLQFDGVALPIEGGDYSRGAEFATINTETYTNITIDTFIGNNTNGGVEPNNDLYVYWFSNISGGLLGVIPKISSSGRFSFELPLEARDKNVSFYVQELNPPLYSERLKGQIITPVHPSAMNESVSIICSLILLNFDQFDINNNELTTLLVQVWIQLQEEYTGGGWPTVPGYPSPAQGLTQGFGGDDYVMLWNAIINDFSDTLITIDGVKYGKNPLTYGVTNLNFQRRTPVSVLVPLDSPEAVSFIRVGSDVKTGTPGERYRKVMEQLKASKDYTTTKFGSNFPGSNSTGIRDFTPSPIGPKAGYATWGKAAEKNAQQSTSTFTKSQSVSLTPPKTQAPQKSLSPQQLANIDKQIKDLQRQSEKSKQDAKNNQWRAVGEIALGALQAAAILSPIPGDEAVVAAALAAKTGPKAAGAFAKANPGKYNPFLSQQTNKYLNLPRK